MRWRGVGAMGGVGGGGWGVGIVLVPTVWSGERSTLKLSGAQPFARTLKGNVSHLISRRLDP